MSRLIATVAMLSACAAEAPSSDEDFTDLAGLDAKSDAFSAKLRLLGTIHPGTTLSSLEYTSEPRFRGLVFLADPGDSIRLDVRSTDGDAVAWLLDSDFRTLAKNDDADASTRDAAIDVAVSGSADPIHYIVWKEITDEDATFAVSFVNRSLMPRCTIALSPNGGPVSGFYRLTWTSEDANDCVIVVDDSSSGRVSCNDSNGLEGRFLGVGEHTFKQVVHSANDVAAECSTTFTLTP